MPTTLQPTATPPPALPRTLAPERAAFVAAIRRDTPGTDLPRYVAALDALLAWTVAQAPRLAFRTDPPASGVLRCARVGDSAVFWAARTNRGRAPSLEIAPPPARTLSAARRAHAMATLNAHSREVLTDGDRLRIGFGALKNAAARAAVLALMDELLAGEVLGGPPLVDPPRIDARVV